MQKTTKLLSKLSMLIILSLIIYSCSPDTEYSNTEPLVLEVGYNPEKCENLEISCPIGVVCDENFDYRAYKFENTRLFFYISFAPTIIDNYSLESFRDNFNYLNFYIYFPERNKKNSQFYYFNKNPIWQLNESADNDLEFTLDSYENGNLKGVLKGTITEITNRIHSNSSDCMSGDEAGICFKTEEADMPFTVNFNFCIE